MRTKTERGAARAILINFLSPRELRFDVRKGPSTTLSAQGVGQSTPATHGRAAPSHESFLLLVD
eukprot:scaffold137339_cov33-Tisochrysis_lutea.AAC.2